MLQSEERGRHTCRLGFY